MYTTSQCDVSLRPLPASKSTGPRFEFYRFRFHFRAVDPVHFPPGKSGNVLRGCFGKLLRDLTPPQVYARLFEPSCRLGKTPSGIADWPRPFILRSSHLDGITIAPGEPFHFDLHVFDLNQPALPVFRTVFTRIAGEGLGPGRGCAAIERVEQIDLDGRPETIDNEDHPRTPSVLTLTALEAACVFAKVRFVTPTELKGSGSVARQPEFAVLFGRLRDRIGTLRALYGPGPMELDFRGMGERASQVRLRHCDLRWEKVERRSGRTGQVHPLGGFTGVVEYEGELAEFLPWLRAAHWVGVGRQTVWGKGDMQVME